MLDSLLGRKFSAKCKQSIKCIKTRIGLIRKKKQAILNFLKKDVADLLASGHDTIALGRMDGLIVEMNNISCYDMIEHFCDCILGHLSCLEKQRECPQEEMEAVATLIFAAARFSDLPELVDLRHAFISRYGSALESSVNAQFVEKIVTKSFTKDKKLKMMQDISQEFTVAWNLKLFDQKRINPSPMEVPKKTNVPISIAKQEELHALVNEQKSAGIDTQQEIAIATKKQDISTRGRTESALKYDVLKEIKHTQVKDIHMVSNLNNGFQADCTKNSGSAFCDEPKNSKPSSTVTTVPYSKPGHVWNCYNVEDQQDAVIANKRLPTSQEGVDTHVRERQIRELEPSHDRVNIAPHVKPKEYTKRTYTFDYNKNNVSYDRSSSLHRFVSLVPEEEVTGMVKSHDGKEGSDTAGLHARGMNHDRSQNMVPHINKKRHENGNHAVGYHEDVSASGISKTQNRKAGLVKSHDDKGGSDTAGQHARGLKMNHDMSQNMFPPRINQEKQDYGNHAVDYHMDSSASGMSNTQDGLYLSVPEKQVTGLEKHDEGRLKNMIPPYVKPKGAKAGLHAEELHDDVVTQKSRSQQDLEPPFQEEEAFQDVKSVRTLPLKNMTPPYVKLSANKNGYQLEHLTSAISTIRDDDASVYSRSNEDGQKNLTKADLVNDKKPEPRSVRRKHSKLQMVYENNDFVDGSGPLSTNIPSERKHGERRRAAILEDDYDEEEMVMDRLLMHYSRKGTAHQKSKSRTRTRTRAADNNNVESDVRKHHRDHHQGHSDVPEAVHTLQRAVTLPSKQMGQVDVVKKPARIPSMEPGMSSPLGGRVHPCLPDYDELTARFNALKRS